MRTIIIGTALLVGLGANQAAAKSYDAMKQFSTVVNTDTNTWSYRKSDGGGHDGAYSTLTDITPLNLAKSGKPYHVKIWYRPTEQDGVPIFWANKTTVPVLFHSSGQDVSIPAHTLVFHPGFNGVAAVLRFLAPSAGRAMVKYDFTHLDWACGGSGSGIVWTIEKNSGAGALATGSLYSPNSSSIATTGPHTLNVQVAQGDRINFILDGAASSPICDSTGLTLTVTLP